jgi:hypothetical protein
MLQLRDEVLRVDDETGDISKVAPLIEDLGNYVLNHMNTNLGSAIELPGTYATAVEKIRKQVEKSGSANSKIYAEAQKKCEDPFIPLPSRAQCIQDYVLANAKPGTDVRELEFPDKSLYSYSFASPFWSPDLAGFSVLISVFSLLAVVFLVLTRILVPVLSKIIDRDPLE